MKPIHKLNGGLGATLCHTCSVIITTGLTKDLYCERCKPKQDKIMERFITNAKQETIEEAGAIAAGLCEHLEAKEQAMFIAGFQERAKWQQERSYSEEDMRKAYSIGWITRERFDDLSPDIIYPKGLDYEEKQDYAFNLWFEQFKKK